MLVDFGFSFGKHTDVHISKAMSDGGVADGVQTLVIFVCQSVDE
jgi:hypothetical protein